MKLEPECVGCLFNQVNRAFKMLKPDISREIIITAQKKLMEFFITVDINDSASPIIGKVAYNLVSEMLGEKDPYSSLKDEYNRLALDYYNEAKEIVDKAADPLFEAIIVAALGNTIDFAGQHEIDLIKDLKNFSPQNLIVNDYLEFKSSLENTNHLLIIGDNCGEIVFDKLLITTIRELYPDLEIIYSVRAAPIINDATLEDAEFVGMTELVPVIESSPTPGIDIPTSTKEFKKVFYQKGGIILSKGQGNFESLFQMDVPDKEIYYLLKAKCTLMERIFGVKIGDLIFKKKVDGF
ncbi:MAG: damage-control phosphatase ARMT1 family protein [Promethearchaeota archaeon]